MKTFEAIVLIANVMDKNGNVFTEGACRSIVDQINKNIFPVTWNFDPREPPIGKTISARYENSKVIARFQFREKIEPEIFERLQNLELYAGPGVIIKEKTERGDGLYIIETSEMACMGIFPYHADEGATPLKEIPYEQEGQ
jgi:hypothetical protein